MTIQNGGYLVTKAYQDTGLVSKYNTPSLVQLQDGIERLNDIINLWATQGLKLWLQEDLGLTLTAGKTTYSMGPGGDLNMVKPLSVFQAYYLTSTQSRQPLTILSRDEWTRLSQTNVLGSLNSFFPDKQLTFLYVSFYNTPDVEAATGTARLITRVAAQNFTATTDTVGFPPEWYIALRWALADDLATGQPAEVQARCAQRAGAYRTALEDFDVEDAPTFFQPDSRIQYAGGRFR